MIGRLFFLLLLLVSATLTLFLGGATIGKIWKNYSYSRKAPATIEQWSIVKRGENSFYLQADFSYKAGNGIRKGKWLFPKKYLNAGAAKWAISDIEEPLTCWYHPSHPGKYLFEKGFPYNHFFRFILSSFLFLYFLIKSSRFYKKIVI